MAKAKRIPTKYAGVYKLEGTDQFFWRAYGKRRADGTRPTDSNVCDTLTEGRDARAAAIKVMTTRSDLMESDPLPSKITLAEYFPGFLDRQIGNGSIELNSKNNYLNVLKRMERRPGVRGILHMKMVDVRPSHIENLYADLRRVGRLRGEGGYAFRTILAVHDLLKVAFNRAVPEFITVDPMERIKKPYSKDLAPSKKKLKHFQIADAKKLLAHVATMDGSANKDGYNRILVFWIISFDLGTRLGETAAIREEWINLETGAIHLQKQRTYQHGSDTEPRVLVEKDLKGQRAGDEGKHLLLSPPALEAVRLHIRQTKKEQLAFGPGYDKSGYLIVHSDGTPFTPAQLYQHHRRACRLAGVPYRSPHGMRHSTATWLSEIGQGISAIQGRLAHANPATSELYTNPSVEAQLLNQAPAAQALGEHLFGT